MSSHEVFQLRRLIVAAVELARVTCRSIKVFHPITFFLLFPYLTFKVTKNTSNALMYCAYIVTIVCNPALECIRYGCCYSTFLIRCHLIV